MTRFKGGVSLCVFTVFLAVLCAIPLHAQETEYRFERMWPTLQQPWYFSAPESVAIDALGFVYIADTQNHRIIKFSSNGQYVKHWGKHGTSPGRFNEPTGVAISSGGEVYVTDKGNNRIQKFAADGSFLQAFGGPGSGDGQFNLPFGIALDNASNVFVSEYFGDRIQVFSEEGEFLYGWGTSGTAPAQFDQPMQLAISLSNEVFVADARNNRIQVFDLDGIFLRQLGSNGAGNGQFYQPFGVAVDHQGFVYVADTGNRRVQKLTANGAFVQKWGAFGMGGNGQFYQLGGIAVTTTGNVLAIDTVEALVQEFTDDGTFIGQWGSSGRDPGFFLPDFQNPFGIAVSGAGSVFVADSKNSRIQKFTSAGICTLTWDSVTSSSDKLGTPSGLVVDNTENIVVVDSSRGEVIKYDSNGNYILKWGEWGTGPSQFQYPTGIANDSSGNYYIADTANHRVQKFSNAGGHLLSWGNPGTGPGQLNSPMAIVVDDNDVVYVRAGGEGAPIKKFTSAGAFISEWGTMGAAEGKLFWPMGLAFDASGDLIICNTYNHRVEKWTNDGAFIGSIMYSGSTPGETVYPNGVAVDDEGTLFITESGNKRVQVLREITEPSNAKAIICAAGGAFPGNNLWNATQLSANFAYRTLTYQGFTKGSVYYLSSDTDLDLDGNGQADDVDADATNANLQSAITSWAATGGTEDVVVYLVDHGGDGSFRMSATETLSATQLDAWLDTLQASITGTLTVIYDACQSGSFQAALAPTGGQKRIVITSAATGQNAYFLSQGTISFSVFFWTNIFNGLNVTDSYNLATQAMTQAIATQTPQMVSANMGTTFIGNGTVIQGEAPVIGDVSDPQAINGTSTATLWADPVTDADGIARVWAVLRPPNFTGLSPDNPVQELPNFDLQPMGDDRYEASYSGFTTPGLYQIAVYARDRIGNTSVPVQTTVSVASPVKRKALIVGGGAQPDPQWASYENALLRCYNALKVQGYTNDTIAFRSPVTFNAGVDGAPSLSNIEYLIKQWGTYDTHDLLVYFVGPASAAGIELNARETLSPASLKQWLDVAQVSIPGIVTVVLDTSDSGGAVTQLAPLPGKQRINIGSARANEQARFLANGDLSFSSYFWTGVLNGANVQNAFKQGQIAMRFSGFGQFAGLDDNGNGKTNEKLDGVLSRTHYIGAGIKLAGDDPVIGVAGVSPALLTSGSEATVYVEDVTTTGTIDYVTASITPPGDGIQYELELLDVGGGRYEAVSNTFTAWGDYHISVVAVDSEGNTSLPADAVLTQTLGPDGYEVDDTLAQSTETDTLGAITRHNFHDAGDADWLYFWGVEDQTLTIETLNLEPACDPEIALFHSDGSPVEDPAYCDGGDCQVRDDDTSEEDRADTIIWTVAESDDYYLRVRYSQGGAPPGFGADTGYDVRVSHEVGECLYGTARVTVHSGTSYSEESAISDAYVELKLIGQSQGQLSKTNVSGDVNFLAVGPGTYEVRVTKDGYAENTKFPVVPCTNTFPPEIHVTVDLTATDGGPKLGLEPASLEFGFVPVNTQQFKTLTVTNIGTGTLTGTASIGNPYSVISGGNYSLGAGQSQTLTVRFAPLSSQNHSKNLSFTGGVTLLVSGRGFNPTTGVIGDVNKDGSINILDATLISFDFDIGEVALNDLLQQRGLPAYHPILADANNDNQVSGMDANYIRACILLGLNPHKIYIEGQGQRTSHIGAPIDQD